jgi:hypothetical protein
VTRASTPCATGPPNHCLECSNENEGTRWPIIESVRRQPAKHVDLLSHGQIFCLQLCSQLEERSQEVENQLEQIGHQTASLARLFFASMPNPIFGTHSGSTLGPVSLSRELSMPSCLNVQIWRASTPPEVVAYFDPDRPKENGLKRHTLVVRSHLKPVDVYSYLMARFGQPNGFQNFLRRDDSDNWIHWDFNIKADLEDVYFAGTSREIHISTSEKLTDEEWKELILAIKSDYRRVAKQKSQILRSFEKFVVFQNKFVSLAELCAELHAEIVDAPPYERPPPIGYDEDSLQKYKDAMTRVANRANQLYGNSLKLRLLTPIMVEAFINMLILMFCKSEVRDDRTSYENFIRANVPDRLALLSDNCVGFDRPVDKSTSAYASFMRVINKRNFALHGNVDPVREKIEVVYFDGRRPLFVTPGDHIEKFFEQLESQNTPEEVVKEYEDVQAFLFEITECLSANALQFFEQVISDAYPGYKLKKKRVTRILPDYVVLGMLQGMRYDDQLKVQW